MIENCFLSRNTEWYNYKSLLLILLLLLKKKAVYYLSERDITKFVADFYCLEQKVSDNKSQLY